MPVSWKAELFVVARIPAEIVSTSGSDVLIFAFPAPFFLATDLTASHSSRSRRVSSHFFLSFFFLLSSLRRMVASKEEKGNKKVRKGKERKGEGIEFGKKVSRAEKADEGQAV